MKLLTVLLLLLNPIALVAQISSSGHVSGQLGYETNVFLNPAILEQDEEVLERADLWDNGTFQGLSLHHTLKARYGDHKLKLITNGSIARYQTELDANRYTYDLGFSYRSKFAPKKYIEFSPLLNRVNREGINLANAVIRTPFSFTMLTVPLHLDFYLGQKTWLKTEGGYRYKRYDRSNGESLHYTAPFLNMQLSKKWVSDRSTRKLTLRTAYMWRTYQELELRGASDAQEGTLVEDQRNWNFYQHMLEYQINLLQDRFELTAGLYHLSRVDVEETNTYHQLSPGARVRYSKKSNTLTASVKYSWRHYPTLTPGRGNTETLLAYRYLRVGLRYERKVKKSMHWFATANLTNRSSNVTDLSLLGFREYLMYQVQTGIRLNW